MSWRWSSSFPHRAEVLFLLIGQAIGSSLQGSELIGETFVHDPSTIIQEAHCFTLFATGRGILTKSSSDLKTWKNGPPVFAAVPQWTTNLVPGYRGYAWAPDVVRLKERYYLYYSVSSFGRQTSAIGLASGGTIDPSSPDWHWADHGPVVTSTNGSPYNAIDASVLLDKNGRLWMAFGSFWGGIYLIELNPETGLAHQTGSTPCRLAWAESIEAPCLTRQGSSYYLFVNWGRCCRGTNSTYEMRVGRSESITGPYRDRAGRALLEGGGTLFLKSNGRFIGPGHVGILQAGDRDWVSYHYYDAQSNGRSRLALAPLRWTKEDWPEAVP